MIDKLPDTSYTEFKGFSTRKNLRGFPFRSDHQLSMIVKSKEHYDRIVNQIKLDHGMWHEAVKLLDRECKKNNQINETKQDLEDLNEITQYVIKAHNKLIDERDELKLIKSKIIIAKRELVIKLSNIKQMNESLNWCCEEFERRRKEDKLMISLLRHQLDQRTRPDVIHLHRKDLENLKDYRVKYKNLIKSIGTKCVEATKIDHYVTADIYRELLPVLIE